MFYESAEDAFDSSVLIFPENTKETYDRVQDLPTTSLVETVLSDGSISYRHPPVAIEVLPVCRVNPLEMDGKPKCCIDHVNASFCPLKDLHTVVIGS